MKKIVVLFFLGFIVLISCKTKYNLSTNDRINLNASIDEMYSKDQNSRLYFDVIDSLFGIKKNTISKDDKIKLIGQTYYVLYEKKCDSLWKSIKKIDEENTVKLISITEKYGFPNSKRLNVYKSKAYFIFVHSPESYFPKINELIDFEFKNGRIDEYSKDYIFWHTKKNSEGMPPRRGKNGESVY